VSWKRKSRFCLLPDKNRCLLLQDRSPPLKNEQTQAASSLDWKLDASASAGKLGACWKLSAEKQQR
jgi:hypothetical protein